MPNSTLALSSRKSASKPHPDFPLYCHASGNWAKKVRNRTRYFGKIATDPKGIAALDLWLLQKDDLLAGRKPRANADALTVDVLCNHFLAHKEQLRDHGELNPRTFHDYYLSCATVVKSFGKGRAVSDLASDDFGQLRATLAKTRGAVSMRNEMQRIRSIFKFAFDEGLIDIPVRFGQSFAKPKLDAVRRAREADRAANGDRMFESAELRSILATAQQPLRAMVLLGINCGYGQSDVSALPIRAINLESGCVDFPRPKTGVQRKCPLFPETVAAIREWLTQRPIPKDKADSGLLFLTCRGSRWVKLSAKGTQTDAVGQEFNKILVGLNLKRRKLGFYGLRHGFETIAGETADQVAVDAIMGHVPHGMAGAYRERISDARLLAAVNHVRTWLWPELAEAPKATDVPKRKQIRERTKSNPRVTNLDSARTAVPALRIVG